MRCCDCFLGSDSVGPDSGGAHTGGQNDSNSADVLGAAAVGLGDAGGESVVPAAYSIRVDGFDVGVRGRRVVYYTMTVCHGSARWPLRRRYRQIAALHARLLQGVGKSRRGLPRIPPKVTCAALLYGKFDERFLAARMVRLQRYFDALLTYVRHPEQFEPLHEFLCSVDLAAMSYEALLDLGQAIGRGGPATPPIEASAIAALPRKSQSFGVIAGSAGGTAAGEERCVICQDPLRADEASVAREGDDQMSAEAACDVRVLPCGHEYHFHCIERWVHQSNTCCVCHSIAVLPRPPMAAVSKQSS